MCPVHIVVAAEVGEGMIAIRGRKEGGRSVLIGAMRMPFPALRLVGLRGLHMGL